MGAFQRFLWDNMSAFVESLPEDKKLLARTFQQEGLSVAKQQMLSARHTVNATAAKFMATSVALRLFLALPKMRVHTLKTFPLIALLMLKLMT